MTGFIPPKREGGFYITKDEKKELTKEGTEMEVLSVERGSSPFGDGDRYLTTVLLNGVERGLSYNTGVVSRDELLSALGDYLDNEQDQETVSIYLTGVKTSNGRTASIINIVGAEEDDDEEE